MSNQKDDFPRCCEKGTREQPVCPKCAEINDGYQRCLGVSPEKMPHDATASIEGLTARIAELELEEEGAKEAFGVLVEKNLDLEASVNRRQGLLESAYEIVTNQARHIAKLELMQGVLTGVLKLWQQAGTLHERLKADQATRAALAQLQQSAQISAAQSLFPERDMSKPAEQQGMFRKFIVRRVDGSDAPGGKHYGCRYFVLDLDHDAHAAAAMRAYSADCASTHPQLSRDICARFGGKGVDA